MTMTKSARPRKLYASKQELKLEKPIGAGREGSVHPVTNQPLRAVKLIGTDNPNPSATADKLRHMVEKPPEPTASRHYQITWPASLVSTTKRGQATAGYTMTLMNPEKYRPIGAYFNPSRRKRLLENREKGYTYLHLVKMALNLSRAVARLHAHGAVIGDLNSRNVLASDQGRIAIIDTDSFQVENPETGEMLRSMVGTPEYTPPRLQGVDFAHINRNPDDDLFALGVMLYQLMVQGSHPYAGRNDQNGNHAADDVATRIAHGRFAHGNVSKGGGGATLNNFIVWHRLPLKREFKAAFQSNRPRTTASAWAKAIEKAARNLKQCPKNTLHWHFGKTCTWCLYLKRTGIEPFPKPGDAGTRRTAKRRPRDKENAKV